VLREGITLVSIGSLTGALLAALVLPALVLPARLIAPRNMYGSLGAFADPTVDGRFVAFALGVGIAAAILCAAVPAFLPQGVDTARWTFDPLVAKNAHINFNRLGAVVVEHVENMYGDSNSTLHAGLGTDRFVVEWRLADERVARVIAEACP